MENNFPFELAFSYNWNNKLDCKCFTTIRLTGKWKKGMRVNIVLKGVSIGTGFIVDVKTFYLKNLNDYMSYIDTGYDKEKCTNIILKMYSAVDFSNKTLDYILIVKDEK